MAGSKLLGHNVEVVFLVDVYVVDTGKAQLFLS